MDICDDLVTSTEFVTVLQRVRRHSSNLYGPAKRVAKENEKKENLLQWERVERRRKMALHCRRKKLLEDGNDPLSIADDWVPSDWDEKVPPPPSPEPLSDDEIEKTGWDTQCLDDYGVLLEKVSASVKTLFGAPNEMGVVIQEFTETGGTDSKSLPFYEMGVFYVPLKESFRVSRMDMACNLFKRSIPGSYWQRSCHEKSGSRLLLHTAKNLLHSYVGGWEGYSLQMCDQLGLFEEDLSRLGFLCDQLVDQLCCVVDTAFHMPGIKYQWSIDRSLRLEHQTCLVPIMLY